MISAIQGDITRIQTQAIVNSANPTLLAGGGVCGAIHKAAGPELEARCKKIGRIEPGQAILTDAFNLPAAYVIHAVAPRFLDGKRGEPEGLIKTYIATCEQVIQNEIMSLSIPSIGTGIYRFPLELAASIAIQTLHRTLPPNCTAKFVCFDQDTLATYQRLL